MPRRRGDWSNRKSVGFGLLVTALGAAVTAMVTAQPQVIFSYLAVGLALAGLLLLCTDLLIGKATAGPPTARMIASYRERLRTDSTLGLVNSRKALENSQATYEAVRERAFEGDRDAMEEIHEAAETYRRNLTAFSPSSALVNAVITEIDQTLTKILLAQKK